LVAIAAGVPALLYFLFVLHYSVNVPWSVDDWSIIPLVDAALHGHLGMSALWTQYGDRRLVVGRLVLVEFGLIDYLNEQSVMLFSAIIFIVSYVLFLLLFRSYLSKSLTFLPVLMLGVVWFSLVDYLNALWSFQLSWYLVVFFFVAMAYLLLVPQRHGNLVVGLGIVTAVAGSLSDVQGLILWPIGAICLLWTRGRRTHMQIATWIAAALITTTIYFRGYSFANVQCFPRAQCSFSFELQHPVLMAKYFSFLVGNVASTRGPWTSIGYYELVGTVICLAAGYVVFRSIRERRVQVNPLPLVLIAFGVAFDLLLVESRAGRGIGQFTGSDYTMPNLLLLLGIVVYAWTHVLNVQKLQGVTRWRRWLRILGVGTLAVLLVAQSTWATERGIAGGKVRKQTFETDARVLTNRDRIPSTEWACYEAIAIFPWVSPTLAVYFDDPKIAVAARDGLSLFSSRAEHHLYRAEGPPVIAQCDRS